MNYYINPAWFYWIKVLDETRIISIVSAVIFGAAIVFLSIAYASESDYIFDEEDERTLARLHRLIKIAIAVFVIAVLCAIFIPDKNTLIEMQIARYATRENVDATIESIKSFVDYIVESISKLK